VVAEAVAILGEALAGGRARSVGIVTFNAEQQALVENLLDEARGADPRLEPFFSDDASDPVLVKNLEGVQGEERDVMLFSLTYGPDAAGRVAMNFGPLNQAGGERRLNVAITRARQSLLVFGSLRPEHIDLSRTPAVGVAHLKQFLDYAIRGAQAFARATTAPLGDYESPFESAVAERLAAKGWTLHPQVGVSGFRIDLAVVDKDAPGAYPAGVECDGATYHSAAGARDRDRLRQLVLERLGWRVLRIWSTDWWTNAARECDRLHAALEAAQTAVRAERAKRAQVAVAAPPMGGDADAATAAEPTDETAREPAAAIQGAAPGVAVRDTAPSPAAMTVPTADAAQFYEDGYRSVLRVIIAAELARSGPLRRDRLAQRIARLHGFQRTGREIQDRIAAAIPRACRRTEDSAGEFVWPPGADPAAWDRFPRRQGAEPPLDPAELPLEVLTVLARECLANRADQEVALQLMGMSSGWRASGSHHASAASRRWPGPDATMAQSPSSASMPLLTTCGASATAFGVRAAAASPPAGLAWHQRSRAIGSDTATARQGSRENAFRQAELDRDGSV
jgi:very-short-patch-repair endonuclease